MYRGTDDICDISAKIASVIIVLTGIAVAVLGNLRGISLYSLCEGFAFAGTGLLLLFINNKVKDLKVPANDVPTDPLIKSIEEGNRCQVVVNLKLKEIFLSKCKRHFTSSFLDADSSFCSPYIKEKLQKLFPEKPEFYLALAVRMNHFDYVKKLLELGVAPNYHIFHIAAKHGSLEIFNLILKRRPFYGQKVDKSFHSILLKYDPSNVKRKSAIEASLADYSTDLCHLNGLVEFGLNYIIEHGLNKLIEPFCQLGYPITCEHIEHALKKGNSDAIALFLEHDETSIELILFLHDQQKATLDPCLWIDLLLKLDDETKTRLINQITITEERNPNFIEKMYKLEIHAGRIRKRSTDETTLPLYDFISGLGPIHKKDISQIPPFALALIFSCATYEDLLTPQRLASLEGEHLKWIIALLERIHSQEELFAKLQSISPSFLKKSFIFLSPKTKAYILEKQIEEQKENSNSFETIVWQNLCKWWLKEENDSKKIQQLIDSAKAALRHKA